MNDGTSAEDPLPGRHRVAARVRAADARGSRDRERRDGARARHEGRPGRTTTSASTAAASSSPERHRYLLLNKPRGYVTTRSDPQQRPTVLDLLHGVREYVYPVGRLDFDSEGLLLLTNDGDLAARLTHPSHGVARVYEARVLGVPDAHDLERLRAVSSSTAAAPRPAEVKLLPSRPRRQGRRAMIDHDPRGTQPPGPEDVRRDRPPGRSPAARRDRTDQRSEAEASGTGGS